MVAINNINHKSEEERSRILKAKKMKQVAMEEDFDLELTVTIHSADGIDETISSKSLVTSRIYRVIFWVHPEERYHTRAVYGDPDPTWRERYRIMVDRFQDCRFLKVEVIRHDCAAANEEGTSNGIVMVGRAQIPLPTSESSRKGGRYGLVRLDGDGYKAEGHVLVSMELEKLVYDDDDQSCFEDFD